MKRYLLSVVLTLAAIPASANSNQQNDLPVKSRSVESNAGPDSTDTDTAREHSDDSLNQTSSEEDVCAAFLGGDGSDDESGFDALF